MGPTHTLPIQSRRFTNTAALERLAGGYSTDIARAQHDLAIAESQLRDYRERLGKPFLHDNYLSQLTDLRDQLKSQLSASAFNPVERTLPDANELAESIKRLKAAHTIEAAPNRLQHKQIAAEEPITARIRRRKEANAGPGGAEQAVEVRVGLTARPVMTFQERIALGRRVTTQEPSLD